MFELKKILKPALAAAFLAIAPLAASATTVFNVTDNSGGQALAAEVVNDGAVFTQSLIVEDSVSIDVSSLGLGSTGAIGFTFSPSPLAVDLTMALSTSDFGLFGDIEVSLSTSSNVGDIFATETASPAGLYSFFGVAATSPLYVMFDWDNAVTGSFNADLTLSPVPVPAAGFLLLGALGGLGFAGRRRRKAA